MAFAYTHHMYKWYALILCLVSIGCQSTPSLKKDETVTPRDYSITPREAYNDLFLDSLDVEAFLLSHSLNDTLARRIRSFYNARNFQFAWFHSSGLTEQGKGFWNLQEYIHAHTPDTVRITPELIKTMDRFYTATPITVNAGTSSVQNTEMYLTLLLMEYAMNHIREGYIHRESIESFIPVRKEEAKSLAQKYIEAYQTKDKEYSDVNPAFAQLIPHIAKYHRIVSAGGWPVVTGSPSHFLPGQSNAHVQTLIQRLRIDEYIPEQDSVSIINTQVQEALSKFEVANGLSPTGKVSTRLLQLLNVPAEVRLKQLLINLDRMQWLIQQPTGKLLLVNIPEFVLHVKDGSTEVFQMDVVVGKEANSTTIFNGDLNQVVFSPYWNIPPGILRNEILPAMENNKNYLAEKNMEMVSQEGALPVIRQLPGPSNALGKVKFLFPNKFNIYFHDTPAKDLFKKDRRAFSHGCIRLSDPAKLAAWLLKDESGWNDKTIAAAMNKGTEQTVVLKEKVPVCITYYTAWVDENNVLRFAPDIYGHDEAMMKRRFR